MFVLLLKENIMNSIYNKNNILVFFNQCYHIYYYYISNKKQNFKKTSYILFPFLIFTIENGLESVLLKP